MQGHPIGWSLPDREGSIWAAWWTGEALLQGAVPWTSNRTFWPVGEQVLSQFNLLDALVSAAPIQLLGPGIGFAVGCLLLLWLDGLAHGSWRAPVAWVAWARS